MLRNLLHGILLDDATPDLPGSGGATAVAEPSQAAPELSGIDKATAEFDALVGQPEPKEAAPKEPSEKPAAEKGKEKPADKPKPDAKEKDAKPAVEAEDAKLEKLIKPHQGAWKAFQEYKRVNGERMTAKEKEVGELRAKMTDLEKRPQTAANDEKYAKLEQQLKEAQGTLTAKEMALAEADYRKSGEFQDKYTKRAQKVYADATGFVKRINIKDADGVVVRAATEADFNNVRAQSPENRREVAEQLFGRNAQDVLNYVNKIADIQEEAEEAANQHASQYETKRQEQERMRAEEQKSYTTKRAEAQTALQKKHPQFFDPEHYKDQPELKSELEAGYAYVDKATENIGKMSLDDRAATVAVLRGMTASSRMLIKQVQAKDARIAELEAEIAKGREAEPSKLKEKGGKGGGEGGDDMPKGIEDAAKMFNDLK